MSICVLSTAEVAVPCLKKKLYPACTCCSSSSND